MIDIIPAIDVINGKCVRLTKGDYSRKTEYGDPLGMALRFQDHGFKRLHLVDLDGAREGRVMNYRILEQIVARTSLVIDAGGGIKSDEDLRIVFESGAAMATGGSIAVKNPELFEGWLNQYGPERIILGSDFINGNIAVSGWIEETEEELLPFIGSWFNKGIRMTICTDISKDGVLQGTSEQIYSSLLKEYPDLYLIASGGVSSIDDILSLDALHIPAVIIGKAIYEKRIKLGDLEQMMR